MNGKQTSGLVAILALAIVAASWFASGRIPAIAIEHGREGKDEK
jgi:hypothetical protein